MKTVDVRSAATGSRSAMICKPSDSVAIALKPVEAGDLLRVVVDDKPLEIRLLGPLPTFHKFAVHRIPAGQVVLKQGEAIGVALRDIAPGEHVHVHNLSSLRAR
ncbi:MAG TPA: UxaA family hydrolase [Ramlibacter sp.]|uniref:UxaA family hydrolase n=1 Tax=Ramlibacter sp. TaxID=1917967 RepID=UPI002BB910C9|nr:UxaA family hydrolase [Ramlibacter sp.]HVZ44176.1 UxaA family hydrolase [Ramlibacter sp.]